MKFALKVSTALVGGALAAITASWLLGAIGVALLDFLYLNFFRDYSLEWVLEIIARFPLLAVPLWPLFAFLIWRMWAPAKT